MVIKTIVSNLIVLKKNHREVLGGGGEGGRGGGNLLPLSGSHKCLMNRDTYALNSFSVERGVSED